MKILGIMIRSEISKFKNYKEKIFFNHLFLAFLISLEYSIYSGILHTTEPTTLSYLLISTCLSTCLLTYRFPKFVFCLRNGEIAKYFTFPKSIWYIALIEDLSESISLLFENIIFFVFSLFFLKINFIFLLYFIVSLFLSILLSVFVGESIFSLTFALHNFSASKALLSGISSVFSGGLIPLMYLPDFFVKICYLTPFALLIDGPFNVLVRGDLSIICWQIIWCILFGSISFVLFHFFSKKIAIFGG